MEASFRVLNVFGDHKLINILSGFICCFKNRYKKLKYFQYTSLFHQQRPVLRKLNTLNLSEKNRFFWLKIKHFPFRLKVGSLTAMCLTASHICKYHITSIVYMKLISEFSA